MGEIEKLNSVPIIETERLLLRGLTVEDADDLYEYASEHKVSQYVPWDAHKSLEDSIEFLKYILNAYEYKKKRTWAIELKEEGKLIGTIDYVNWVPSHRKAELTYVLSHHYWGKGFTYEAAQKLLHYGFETMGLHRVEAPIMLENKQSQRVLEKLGMTYEGIARQSFYLNGQYVDLAMYAILKDEI